MLKKFLGAALLASVLLLSGCGDKASVEPSVDERVDAVDATAAARAVDSEVAVVEDDAAKAADEAAAKAAALADRMPVVYFDFDRYNIRSDMQAKVEQIARIMKEESSVNFRIEGNCDEWGTEEYNYALGLRRAKAIQDALVRLGVQPDRLSLISYGESNPVCSESNRECWQLNRRGEFTILP